MALLEVVASQVFVDEDWYRSRYPDAADAISDGKFIDAQHHYIKFGYFEDRMPRSIEVDTAFYVAQNPDIAKSVASGHIESCQAHFERYGFREGRLPYAGWHLSGDE